MVMLGRLFYRYDRCHLVLALTSILVLTLIVSQYIITKSRIVTSENSAYRELYTNSTLSPVADLDLRSNIDGVTLVKYRKSTPILWVGGVPRSGTTLMRVMLDAHPDIRCGEETRVIPAILKQTNNMLRNNIESARLNEAGVTLPLLWSAVASYILTVIEGHGDAAPLLCNKDPLVMFNLPDVQNMFPESKFILMIRDGRAVTHSIISRGITIENFNTKSYDRALGDWNAYIGVMLDHCKKVGHDKCLPVYYEKLILDPRLQMERILDFIGVLWNDAVLHHEKSIGEGGGISLSSKEPSTDQVNKPINQEALNKWQTHIPAQVLSQVDSYAPNLKNLGYRTDKLPMDYSTDLDPILEHSL